MTNSSTETRPLKNGIPSYIELTKIYAVLMIVFVAGVSYAISIEPGFSWLRLLHLIIGIGISASGALALNQFAEWQTDTLMKRTASRPLPSGRILPKHARIYGHLMMWSGYLYLIFFVNGLCCIATIICGVSYLYFYTPMKRVSSFSTFYGSIPGAMIPIMGWLGKYNSFWEFDVIEPSLIILLLSLILFLWQVPHALIITIRYKDDYEKAGMKQLPIVLGDEAAFRHIYFNLGLLFSVSQIPFFYSIYPQLLYVVVVAPLHAWLIFSFRHYVKNRTHDNLVRFYRNLMMYLPIMLTLIIVFNEMSKMGFHPSNWIE